MNMEIVRWKDAAGHVDNVWRPIEEARELEPAPIVTVGMLVKEEPDYIVLVNSYDARNEVVHGDMVILKANIISRTVIPHVA